MTMFLYNLQIEDNSEMQICKYSNDPGHTKGEDMEFRHSIDPSFIHLLVRSTLSMVLYPESRYLWYGNETIRPLALRTW